MAVLKKRRTPHGKTSRQQQQQQQQQLRAKQRFENSRLKPEQVSSIVHDESDTLSYRSYLMINFIRSAEFMDVLMTQPVPNSKIRPPTIYGNLKIDALKEKLAKQKEELRSLEERSNNFKLELNEDAKFLKSKIRATQDCNEKEISEVLQDYLKKFKLRSQDDSIVFHKEKFTHLRGDVAEAPVGYWDKHKQLIKEQKEKALALQKQKEHDEADKERLIREQEEKRKIEIDEERRRKEEEQKEQQQIHLQVQMQRQYNQDKEKELDHQDMNQQEAQQLPDLLQVQAKSQLISNPLEIAEGQVTAQSQTSQQILQQTDESDQQNQQSLPPQNGINSIFGDFGNEPFNSGFDDEFGELDTAFF